MMIPDYINLYEGTALNQGKEGHCVAFALSHILRSLGKEITPEYIQSQNSAGSGGRSKGALNWAKRNNYIRGYKTARSINDVLRSLWKGNPVMVESGNINFRETGKTKKAVVDRSITTRHARCIIGYDRKNKCFIGLNSRGPKWGDSGRFYINISDVGLISPKYSVYL